MFRNVVHVADGRVGVVEGAGTWVELFVLDDERGDAGAEEMDGRADGPDVRGDGVRGELRGLVHWSADEGILGGEEAGGGEAEVGEDSVGVAGLAGGVVEEDVVRFDVAVDNRLPKTGWGLIW